MAAIDSSSAKLCVKITTQKILDKEKNQGFFLTFKVIVESCLLNCYFLCYFVTVNGGREGNVFLQSCISKGFIFLRMQIKEKHWLKIGK